MVKVTQLRGHRGAKCFFFPDGWLLTALFLPSCPQVCVSASFQVPCLLLSLPLPLLCPCLLCLFPVLHPPLIPFSLGLTHPLSLSPLHPPIPVSVSFLQGHLLRNRGIWRSLGTAGPGIPRPLPCGCGRKGGQRAEEGGTAAKLELGPSSGWERNEETRNLGTEGVGVRGAKAAPEWKSGPLPALWADLGLSLDFAQRRSGPRTIRSLNKKAMDPGPRGPRGPGHGCGALPRPQPKKSCLQWLPPPVTATPCGSAHSFQWGCCYLGWGPVPVEAERRLRPADQQGLRGCAPRPRMAKGGGRSAGCGDRVHRALTYELTASALVSPLAANCIGHRYVRLNASCRDLSGRPGWCPGGNGELLAPCSTRGPRPSYLIPTFPLPLPEPALPWASPVLPAAARRASELCTCRSLCLTHPSQLFCIFPLY